MNAKAYIQQKVREALVEDHYRQDVTSKACIPTKHRSVAKIIARQDGVLCGSVLAATTFKSVNPKLKIKFLKNDGSSFKKGAVILTVRGKTSSLLTAERTALNFLGYLSGISTLTSRYVSQVKPYKVKVLGTRKTTPTLRYLEKYAVRCGGGTNHRFNLSEMALIKDNHIAVYDNIKKVNQAIRKLKERKIPVEIEVTSLKQFRTVLVSNPDIIMLDNMTQADMKKAVAINKKRLNRKIPLEASGDITLKNIRSVARIGVDRISIGALTHSAVNINFSMDVKSL